jgi:hypothetical protein
MIRRSPFLVALGLIALAIPGGAIALGGLFVPQMPARPDAAQTLGRELSGKPWHQVSIEQHLIIRITPGGPAVMRDIPPPAPEPLPMRLRPRRMPPCVPVQAIAGVRPLAGDRLLLILRDHRLVGADLSRTCAARDFYMGFYVTPTADGLLCADRDTIHSRAGSTCTVTHMHEMVPQN